MNVQHYPFQLLPLPYPASALEPYIDKRTVEIHHKYHLGTYVKNLNKTLENYPKLHNMSLEKLIRYNHILPRDIQVPVKRNAGGVFNHNLYFFEMGGTARSPLEQLERRINADFGDFENFRKEFTKSALSVFGSGYAWLVVNSNKKLKIVTTANQDTTFQYGLKPILTIDVWEHAYYLKYTYQRQEYIKNWFNVINWAVVEKAYILCLK